MDLPLFSTSFAAISITLYVLLDGFDLGVGTLLLFQPDQVDSLLQGVPVRGESFAGGVFHWVKPNSAWSGEPQNIPP